MKVVVFTNPHACTFDGAGWGHVALDAWGDAVVAWDRDYPHLTLTGIYVYNGDQASLWCGVEEAPVLYGRRSSVVRWCPKHARWEHVQGNRDCRVSADRAWRLSVAGDAYSRRMAPRWRALGIEGY